MPVEPLIRIFALELPVGSLGPDFLQILPFRLLEGVRGIQYTTTSTNPDRPLGLISIYERQYELNSIQIGLCHRVGSGGRATDAAGEAICYGRRPREKRNSPFTMLSDTASISNWPRDDSCIRSWYQTRPQGLPRTAADSYTKSTTHHFATGLC